MTSPWTWVRSLFGGAPTCPECHASVEKTESRCTTCGYELVKQAKAAGGGPRGPV